MEPLIHLVVPFTALTLSGLEWRKALPIALLALLPDLDALFLVHRSQSHSLLVLSAVGLPLLLLTLRLGYLRLGLLGFLAAASHLALDVFAGYTPILWPLYGSSVWVKAELTARIASTPSLKTTLELAIEPTRFAAFQSLDAPLFTGKGLIISVILILPIVIKAFSRGTQDLRIREG